MIESGQLQAKFKHAVDFGIEGSSNRHRASEFEDRIRAHVAASSTRVVLGSFRGNRPVILYVGPETDLVVMTDCDNVFISAWRLSASQRANVLERARL